VLHNKKITTYSQEIAQNLKYDHLLATVLWIYNIHVQNGVSPEIPNRDACIGANFSLLAKKIKQPMVKKMVGSIFVRNYIRSRIKINT
jgi:hypothetical protein